MSDLVPEAAKPSCPPFFGTAFVRWEPIPGCDGAFWQRSAILEDDCPDSLRRKIAQMEDLGWTEAADNGYIRAGLHPDVSGEAK